MVRRSKRSLELGVRFDDSPSRNIVGWYFAVPDIFREALDIRLTERKVQGRSVKEWTRGVPAQISFDVGDVFYDWPGARQREWKDAKRKLCYSVSITAATPDRLADAHIKHGSVSFDLLYFKNGHVIDTQKFEVRQKSFAEFLETGCIRGKIDLR